jgi:hypothetical protein
MLKITVENEKEKPALRLEGRVAGPWVSELRRAWALLPTSPAEAPVAVDLCGVTYVDQPGRALLAEMYKSRRARFIADTPLMQYFVEEAMQDYTRRGAHQCVDPMDSSLLRIAKPASTEGMGSSAS